MEHSAKVNIKAESNITNKNVQKVVISGTPNPPKDYKRPVVDIDKIKKNIK